MKTGWSCILSVDSLRFQLDESSAVLDSLARSWMDLDMNEPEPEADPAALRWGGRAVYGLPDP